MTFGSLFSGCGGMDSGLEDAGMRCAWQVEIDPNCNDVLGRHWPEVPKFRDIQEVRTDELAPVQLIAGGSPCQDLSVAGARAGLDGERSGLFHHFIRIADSQPAAWVLFENVPGLLSSPTGASGEDFAIVLREFSGFWPTVPADGWRSAGVCVGPKRWCVWRMLDSQYFGVPQRRLRLFLVGGPRSGACFPQVLLEPDCLPGNPPPRREARPDTAGSLTSGASRGGGWRAGGDEAAAGQVIAALTASGGGPDDNRAQAGHLVARTLTARGGQRCDSSTENFVPVTQAFMELGESHASFQETETAMALRTGGGGALNANLVAHTLRGEGFDASEDGTGRGTPIIATPYHLAQITSAENRANPQPGDPAPALNQGSRIAIAFQERGRNGERSLESQEELAYALTAPNNGGRAQERLIAYQCHGSNIGPMGTLRQGSGGLTGGVPFIVGEPLKIACACGETFYGELDTLCPSCGLIQSAEVTYPPSRGGQPFIVSSGNTHETASHGRETETARCLDVSGTVVAATLASGVRRLTPRETERLQGYSDDWTRWGANGKEISDSARYRMVGNGVTRSVAAWIGKRIVAALAPEPD